MRITVDTGFIHIRIQPVYFKVLGLDECISLCNLCGFVLTGDRKYRPSLKPGFMDCFRLDFTLSYINSCNVPGTGTVKEQTWPRHERSLLFNSAVRDLKMQLSMVPDQGHPSSQHSRLLVSLIQSDPDPPVSIAYRRGVSEMDGEFWAREGQRTRRPYRSTHCVRVCMCVHARACVHGCTCMRGCGCGHAHACALMCTHTCGSDSLNLRAAEARLRKAPGLFSPLCDSSSSAQVWKGL